MPHTWAACSTPLRSRSNPPLLPSSRQRSRRSAGRTGRRRRAGRPRRGKTRPRRRRAAEPIRRARIRPCGPHPARRGPASRRRQRRSWWSTVSRPRVPSRWFGRHSLLPDRRTELIGPSLSTWAIDRWIPAPPWLSIGNNARRNNMSIQRALVIGAGSGVGQATASALTAAGASVLAAGRERDATDPAQVAALLAESDPDLVVVAAGVRPRMASIEQQSWDSFSAAWNVDVKIAFEVGRAALARPLRADSTVVIVSSGAGLGGSPLSGGYAGAKRTQMFLADYLQSAADARGLGIRFVALVPGQLLVGTMIGEAAAAAYGAESG